MKHIVIILLAIIMAVVALSACAKPVTDNDGEQNPSIDKKIVSISVEGYKENFEYGEVFRSQGLIVNKYFDDNSVEKASPSDIKVDSTNYNAYIPGDYIIEVILIGGALKTSYKVTVNSKGTNGEEPSEDGFDKKLTILSIGNSFSEDALAYFWNIAYELGVNQIVVGHAYIGGSSLSTHAKNISGNLPAYSYSINKTGVASSMSGQTLTSIIAAEEWDVVTIQQASADSGIVSSYNQDMYTIIDCINANIKQKDYKLVWHMTWAYPTTGEFTGPSEHDAFVRYNNDQMQMYNQITQSVRSAILPSEKFYKVIPNGTTIQNLRTSAFKNKLNRDNCHLSLGIGRFVAGLTFAAEITGLDISKLSYRPPNVTITTQEYQVIVNAVKSAVENPYEVTAL